MKRPSLIPTTILSLFLLFCASAGQAATIDYSSFPAGSIADFQLNGRAAAGINPNSDNVLRITDTASYTMGSAFLNAPVTLPANYAFNTTFQFRFNGNGADGVVFVLQSMGNTALGGLGGYLGYANPAITPSVAVEFDNFANDNNSTGIWDPVSAPHISILTSGSVADHKAWAQAPLTWNNSTQQAWIDYNGATMEVRYSHTGLKPTLPTISYDLDLNTYLGTREVFLGFTAGTGDHQQYHDIVSWQFSPVPLPSTLLLLGSGCFGIMGWRRIKKLFF